MTRQPGVSRLPALGCGPTRSAASSCWTIRPALQECRPTRGATGLGSRSALEWVLDQYKEKKPKDPTIRERFNTYRFADHKERVIDLLQRVCAVSVKTMDIVDGMAYWDDGKLGSVRRPRQARVGNDGPVTLVQRA